MVQQLCICHQIQWKSQAMPGPSKAKSSSHEPVHKGHTLNDISPKLNNGQYHSLVDVSSGYHNL